MTLSGVWDKYKRGLKPRDKSEIHGASSISEG